MYEKTAVTLPVKLRRFSTAALGRLVAIVAARRVTSGDIGSGARGLLLRRLFDLRE